MKAKNKIMFVLAGICLAACASEKNPAEVSDGQQEVLVETRTQRSQAPADAYRQFEFARALRGINSREHYVIEARFPREGSRLVLHDHFMGFARRDGVELALDRRGEDLTVRLSTPDRLEVALPTLAHVFAHGPYLRLRIEFHDGTLEGTRVLIWVNDLNAEGARLRPLATLTAATAAIDSQEAKFYSVMSGRGIFAGLETWAVQLQSVRRDQPYVLD